MARTAKWFITVSSMLLAAGAQARSPVAVATTESAIPSEKTPPATAKPKPKKQREKEKDSSFSAEAHGPLNTPSKDRKPMELVGSGSDGASGRGQKGMSKEKEKE